MAQTENTRFLPFSESLREDLRPLARGITAPEGASSFRTAAFSAGEGMEVWLEAWLNPVNGAWYVEHCTKSPFVARQQESFMPAITFFDAVYCCARFEETEKAADKTASGDSTVRFAAEAAGIPFDLEGLPHPASGGRPLTPGSFDERALEVAAKTGALPTRLSAQLTAPFIDAVKDRLAAVPGGVSLEESVRDFDRRMSDTTNLNVRRARAIPFEKAAAAVHDVCEALDTLVQGKFTDHPFPVFGIYEEYGFVLRSITRDALKDMPEQGVLKTAGILSFVLPLATTLSILPFSTRCLSRPFEYAAGNNPKVSAHRYFYKRLNKLDDALNRIPSEDRRRLGEDFRRAAEIAYCLERAAALNIRAQEEKKEGGKNRRSFEKFLRQAAHYIDKGTGLTGSFSKTDAERLKSLLHAGSFPEPETFSTVLAKTRDSTANAIEFPHP